MPKQRRPKVIVINKPPDVVQAPPVYNHPGGYYAAAAGAGPVVTATHHHHPHPRFVHTPMVGNCAYGVDGYPYCGSPIVYPRPTPLFAAPGRLHHYHHPAVAHSHHHHHHHPHPCQRGVTVVHRHHPHLFYRQGCPMLQPSAAAVQQVDHTTHSTPYG